VITLGINAVFHDPAACLVRDGQVLAASEEERFTRIKHGKRPVPFSTWELPFHAIDDCLRRAGIHLREVDHVAYSFDPWLLPGSRRGTTITLPLEPSARPVADGSTAVWDPLFLSSIVNAPRHLTSGAPHHLRARFLGVSAEGPFRWHYVPHHLSHAASAYLPSPFDAAAVMIVDGRGETVTTCYGAGRGASMEMLGQVEMPHSLGLLYERITEHLGFLHSSDEYKVMALASYGAPRFLPAFREAIRIEDDGRYQIHMDALADAMGPARPRGGPLEPRHHDLASSLQAALEESVVELARWLHRRLGASSGAARDALCLAGGVALNCFMNARLRDRGPFRRLWVQPAAGDAGTALGAALWVDARERGLAGDRWRMEHAYLGPGFDDAEIESFLKWAGLGYHKMADVPAETADRLVRGHVVGWFQGGMEFGPRALGSRSILASPLDPVMRDRMNEIKDREDFRPVAPVVLEEEAAEWFTGAAESPFMLFTWDVRPDRRGRIPAVEHVDGSARIQTIRRSQSPLYHDLLLAFKDRTGVPVLVNTSFNTRGEPIVCTPRDAVECFWTSPLDDLVIGSCLLTKKGRRA
jgi:carbamoyltransferase